MSNVLNLIIMRNRFLALFVLSLCMCFHSCTNDVDDPVYSAKSISDIQAKSTEHKFPDVSTIQNNSEVKSKMEEAWNKMKSNASESGRQEYGFFVYYEEASNRIYCGAIQSGPNITECEGSHGTIDPSPDDPNFNLRVCAVFHCHTTLEYCPNYTSRPTGPSSADRNLADSWQIPGLLYDYTASTIYGGDKKDASYGLEVFGKSQRPSIYY